MSVAGLIVQTEDLVRRVTLDRPDSLNSLSTETIHAVADAIDPASADGIRVVLITGAGRGFCSGADVGEEGRPPDLDTVEAANRLVTSITQSPAAVVAAVNGIAAGVGCSIALACDIVIAKESAAFMLAFTKIGLMPDGGASLLVAAAAGRARALRMALLAEKITASEAASWGLIASVVADDSFDAEVARVTGLLASGPPLALAATKRVINSVSVDLLAQALLAERDGQGALLASADFAEGMAAFVQKRPPVFRGA